MALPPAVVLLTAEIENGVDLADFYCPEVEWAFSDGSRSVHQEDCDPFGPDAVVEKRFTQRHAYVAPGEYTVIVTLRQTSRVIARAATRILIQGGSDSASGPYSASSR